jgi:putative membrane protein
MNERDSNQESEKGSVKEPKAGADAGTQLAHQRTDMAMDRNYLAGERTLMAWIRTSLSMISFGFTIGKLGKVLENIQLKGPLGNIRTVSIEGLAYFLVILGTAALLAAAIQHWRRVRELRAMGLAYRFSIAFIVALLLAALGGFALSSLVMQL